VIALLDYGAGNLTSVRKALHALGAIHQTPQQTVDLQHATAIIVPGVGHFAVTHAISAEWRSAIHSSLQRGAALFGICLGMQWLFDGSDEAPEVLGLGLLPGRCVRLEPQAARSPGAPPQILKVPHVGWNSLEPSSRHGLMNRIDNAAQVYFTHSYVAPVTADTAATATYGVPFAAAVECGRVAGVQFHPEKSGEVGLQILRNWLRAV